MTNQANGGATENYKGLLIQYCQERGLHQPTYTETQLGPSDAPQWQVKVSYGDQVHETPEPVAGSKKFAHQVASQQVLAKIESRRESFLTGEVETSALSALEAEDIFEAEDVSGAAFEPIEVPTPLLSTALTIASERITSANPSRYRTLTDSEFSDKVSKLTLKIVRELLTEAEKGKITLR